MHILNNRWMQCTWSRDLNTHLPCPTSGRGGIHICAEHILGREGLAVLCDRAGVWGVWAVPWALLGKTRAGSTHQVQGLQGAEPELLGPAKILACEAAKQTLEIYKQVLVNTRTPEGSLSPSSGLSWGSKSSITLVQCFVRTNRVLNLLLQPIQSYAAGGRFSAQNYKPRDLQSFSSHSQPDGYYLITYICFTMVLELILSSTATEMCLVPPVCADIINNLSKHLPYKCWGKGQGHMFQMEIQPRVVPLVALSYVILSQCNMRGRDSSTHCIVFGCLLTYILWM